VGFATLGAQPAHELGAHAIARTMAPRLAANFPKLIFILCLLSAGLTSVTVS
jgi:Mn2+/Fe2+ NRAMP family transporter